jgi:hypothetical protein
VIVALVDIYSSWMNGSPSMETHPTPDICQNDI